MLKRSVCLSLLLLFTAPVSAGTLGDAAKIGDAQLVEELLAKGADVNEADNFGTPLHWASINGHSEVVVLLVSAGADMGASSDLLGTPLHAATNRGRHDTVAILLEKGAEVDALDKDSRTPLHVAAKNGSVPSVKLLIAAGADVTHVRVGHGGNRYKLGEQTPLHVARQEGHEEVEILLEKAGARAFPVVSAEHFLAKADIENGRELARVYCKTCHVLEAGDPPPAATDHGPPLIGIYGQKVARDAMFNYSAALREFGGEWTDDRLYSFIYRPMLTVPGTLMGHRLVQKPSETADITEFLKSLAY